MPIRRGDFDRIVTVMRVTEVQDEYGAVQLTPTTLAQSWAMKEYKGGGTENVEADRLSPIMDVVWTMDYISGLRESDYIVEDSTEFEIVNIQDLERQRYHKIFTKKRG